VSRGWLECQDKDQVSRGWLEFQDKSHKDSSHNQNLPQVFMELSDWSILELLYPPPSHGPKSRQPRKDIDNVPLKEPSLFH